MVIRVVALFVFFLSLSGVLALEDGYCVSMEVTSINPSSVGADEDFTVGIEIDNCGSDLPDEVVFEITRFSDDIEIQESLVSSVGKMGYANSKRFLVYHMHSSPDAVSGKHVFETKLSYGNGDFMLEKESEFSVTVNTQEPDLAISRIYTNPDIVYSGEKVVLTVDVENAGNGEAKDVRVEIENFGIEGVMQKYLGRIEADENLPARFVFETRGEGIFEGDLRLSYKFGGEIKELRFPLKIQVFSREINKVWIVLPFLVFGVFGYLLFRKKARLKN